MARPTDPLLPPIANWEQPTLDPYERAKGDKDKLYPGQSLLSGQPIPEMVKPPVQYPGEVKALPQPIGGGPNLDQSPISTGSGIHSVMGTTTLSDGRVLPFGSTPKIAWGDTLLPPIPKGFTTKPLTVLNGITPEPGTSEQEPYLGTSEQEADLRTSPYDEDPDEKEETPAAAPQGILKSKTGLKFEEWEIAFPGDYLPAKAFETPDGVEYGVDMGQVRYNMSVLRAEQLIKQEAMKKGRALTEDEVQPIFLNVADEVEKALQEGIEKAQGFDAVWVSATDEGLAEKMAADVKSVEDEYGKLPGVAYATLLTAKAWMNPHTEILYQPGEDTGEATPRQRGAWDTLHWLGQGSLGTVAMSTWQYGLGTKEQYEAIQSGEGVGEMMPEYLKSVSTGPLGAVTPFVSLPALGLRSLGIMDDENEDLLYQIASVPASMAVALFDPDAILAASFGLGKAAKVAMVGAKSVRAISKGAQAAEAWEAALKGANSAWVDARKTSEGIDSALKSFTTKVEELVAKGETTAKAGADDKSSAINELYNSTIAEVQKLSPLAAKAVEWYIAAYARTNKSVPATVGVAVTSARAANAKLAKVVGFVPEASPALSAKVDDAFRKDFQAAQDELMQSIEATLKVVPDMTPAQAAQAQEDILSSLRATYAASRQAAGSLEELVAVAEKAAPPLSSGKYAEQFQKTLDELETVRAAYVKEATPERAAAIEELGEKALSLAKLLGKSSTTDSLQPVQKVLAAKQKIVDGMREVLEDAEAYTALSGALSIVESVKFFKVADRLAKQFSTQTRAANVYLAKAQGLVQSADPALVAKVKAAFDSSPEQGMAFVQQALSDAEKLGDIKLIRAAQKEVINAVKVNYLSASQTTNQMAAYVGKADVLAAPMPAEHYLSKFLNVFEQLKARHLDYIREPSPETAAIIADLTRQAKTMAKALGKTASEAAVTGIRGEIAKEVTVAEAVKQALIATEKRLGKEGAERFVKEIDRTAGKLTLDAERAGKLKTLAAASDPAMASATERAFRQDILGAPQQVLAILEETFKVTREMSPEKAVKIQHLIVNALKANYVAAKQIAEHSKAYLDLAEFAHKNSPTVAKGNPEELVAAFNGRIQELKTVTQKMLKDGPTDDLTLRAEALQAELATTARKLGENSSAGILEGLRKEVANNEALYKNLRTTLEAVESRLVMAGLPTMVNSKVFFKVADQTARKFKIQTRAVTQIEVIKKALGDVAKSYDMLSGDLRQGVKLRDITAPGAAMAKAIEMRKEILTFGQGPAMGAYVSIVDKIITTANLTAMNIKDAAENASRLGRSTLGQSSDVVLQAGKGALDSSRTALDEVTRLIANSPDQATALSQVIKYMDSGDESLALTNGATTVMNLTRTGNTTLWTEGWNTLSALARAKSIDAESPMIQGLARAFFPAGREGATHAKAMQKWVFDLFSAPEKLDKAKNAIAEVAAKGETPTKKMLDELVRAQALVDGTKTFGAFMELLKVRTAAEFGTSLDTINRLEDLRGTVFASQAIANATFLGKAADTVRAELVGVSNQAIVSAANITAGLEHRAGEGFAEAFEVFSRLQIPPKLRIQALDTAKDINNGLVLLEKEAGEVGIINRSLMAELDARFAGLIKATDEFAARSALPEHVLGSQTMGKMLQIWRTSLTSGTLLPRPGHFVNMYFGNLAQMGAQAGWSPVMRVYANEGLSLVRGAMLKVPGVRAGIDRYNKQAAAKVGSSLGSMVENLFNTHVASFFDPKRCPASAKITDVGGKVYEMGALREAAKAQGVMQSFASSAIKELTARDAYSKGASSTRNAMRYITGEHWKDLVDTLEVRQRVGLFMDLVLNKGFTPEKAGKVVRDSLYDWGHAMAPVESSFLARVGLFWRFRKLMLRQGAGIIMAPFQAAYSTKGSNAFVIASEPWRRTRQMLVGAEGVARTLNEAYSEELNTSQQLWDEHLRQVYPWWTSKGLQPVLLNVPLDESERLWHRATGEDATHAAYTMPALTPLESTAMAMGAMATLGAFTFGDLNRKELMGKAIEGASGFVGPATALAMQGFADRLLGHTYTPAAGMKARPYEEAIASLIPGMEPVEVRDTSSKKQEDQGKLFLKDPGKTVMDQSLLFLFRNTPIIGNEAASWIDPMLSDPVDRKGYIEGAEWLIRQWTGIGKEYAHNPALTLSYAAELGLKEAASAYSQKAKLYPKSSLDRDEAQNVGYAYKDFEEAKK